MTTAFGRELLLPMKSNSVGELLGEGRGADGRAVPVVLYRSTAVVPSVFYPIYNYNRHLQAGGSFFCKVLEMRNQQSAGKRGVFRTWLIR